MKKFILAIIPARSGSKRIKDKNIVDVAGKPLIAYSIEEARKSRYIDDVIVSTDSEKIAEISRKFGANVPFIRPSELAQDTTPTLPALKHAIEEYEKISKKKVDIVVLLQPTTPLRKVSHIDGTIEKLLKDEEADMSVSVCELITSINFIMHEVNGYLKFALDNDFNKIRSQDIKKVYQLNGAVYAYKKDLVMKSEKYVFGEKTVPFVMDMEESVDIDNPEDLERVKKIMGNSESKIKIGNRWVGKGFPCYIIAEAGVNHNGSFENAKKLVDIAKESGADAVKFQTFISEQIVTKDTHLAEYQKKSVKEKSHLEMLKSLELSYEDFRKLKKYCDSVGIEFLSTPHSGKSDVDLLDELGVVGFKIGSGDLTNIPFLEYVAEKGKPMIISTGMATMEEISEAVDAIKSKGNEKIIILQCTTAYPCDENFVNLNAMETIRNSFGYITGFSDHTVSLGASPHAVAAGANVIEKHFTIDKNMEGPDHKASLSPVELKELVSSIRRIERILGSHEKKPHDFENKIAEVARKSIVAAKNIPQNAVIEADMLTIKRPGTGIVPKHLKEIIGKKAKKSFKTDELISFDYIE